MRTTSLDGKTSMVAERNALRRGDRVGLGQKAEVSS